MTSLLLAIMIISTLLITKRGHTILGWYAYIELIVGLKSIQLILKISNCR
jgi:hypothetical protein